MPLNCQTHTEIWVCYVELRVISFLVLSVNLTVIFMIAQLIIYKISQNQQSQTQ